MFVKKDRVWVSNAINFQGDSPWQGFIGTVKKLEPGWVHVTLDDVADKTPIPFRERELNLVE